MRESVFQARLVKSIKKRFPGCVVFKTDPTQIQGFPDLLILFGKTWATLECKKSASASHRPNQGYWVNRLNEMSFSAFVYPENSKEVLDAMERSFKGFSEWVTCAV